MIKVFSFFGLLLLGTLGVVLLGPTTRTQKTAIGIFDDHSDVGPVQTRGEVVFDPKSQQYTITGSGTNMWLGSDEFHVVWKRMKGNFLLTTRAQFVGKGVEPHRKIGWIVR